MTNPDDPKIGLALSGAAARSAFYIGFLEELKKANVPIHAIAAQSGAAVVATAFACGTVGRLKADLITNDKSRLRKLILVRSRGGGGLYSLDGVEEYGRAHWALGKRFDEVTPRLCFVGADLSNGEIVPLAMGDLAHAVRISCTVPGLFEPVQWGTRSLVDGGLLSYIPGTLARDLGANIVIGVSVRASLHIFRKNQLVLKDIYNKFKRVLYSRPKHAIADMATRVMGTDSFMSYFENLDILAEEASNQPGFFSVMGRSLDLAIEASKHTKANPDPNFGCDMLIQQGIGTLGDGWRMERMEDLYQEGLVAGKKFAPVILKYIDTYNTPSYGPVRFVTNE